MVDFDISSLFEHEYRTLTFTLADPTTDRRVLDDARSSFCERYHDRSDFDAGDSPTICNHRARQLNLEYRGSCNAATDFDETGLVMWPASLLLSGTLLKLAHKVRGIKTVLELGAGTGLGGITASRLMSSGSRVLFTDGNDKVMKLLHDELLPIHQDHAQIHGIEMSAKTLLWQEAFTSSDHERLGTTPESVDLIIGADITHWPATHVSLPNTVREMLAPMGVAIIAGVNRAEVTYEIMFKGMQESGLQIQAIRRSESPYLNEVIMEMLANNGGSECHEDLFIWIVSKDSAAMKDCYDRLR